MSSYEWQRDGNRVLPDVVILAPASGPELTTVTARALIDTGATTSGIAAVIADRLSLPAMNKRPVHTANGLLLSRRFVFRIGLPQLASPAPFVFDELLEFELKGDMSWPVLVGMDILSQCDFTMLRDGRCRLVLG